MFKLHKKLRVSYEEELGQEASVYLSDKDIKAIKKKSKKQSKRPTKKFYRNE